MTQPVGVILAAGEAARMGQSKQLLPYGETTVLGAVIARAVASGLDRVILVLGAYGDEVLATHDLGGVEVLHNPDPSRGNLSSLLVATEGLEETPVLLLMADMPALDGVVIDAHIEVWNDSPAWLRYTQYADGAGHPLMLSPELVSGLADMHGPKALWPLTRSERAEALVVSMPMPIDVDTPADYQLALDRRAP